ncbi:hypothetical protein [Micromonospora sp. ATCC 39149]|uniref:hypothetical protein n=1 Tax=Micromonospora sp. (strain ATCC 39149 / NRRL 15099 / SCC 1413) TaxID=219305 RepID=UPI001E2D78D8|nr:hypothetical protein [Micromonospora sp. ATCC 39149]
MDVDVRVDGEDTVAGGSQESDEEGGERALAATTLTGESDSHTPILTYRKRQPVSLCSTEGRPRATSKDTTRRQAGEPVTGTPRFPRTTRQGTEIAALLHETHG